jgi:hypothetical protein
MLTPPPDLAIALTNRTIGQEIHILFILILLTITIFFCHSLIRLCMLMLHPHTNVYPAPRIPDMTGPEGFQPIVPIRVHLARDEEAENDLERGLGAAEVDMEKDTVAPPPPAYGLWRSSVRVDPNLLHWQRAQPQPQPPTPTFSHSHPPQHPPQHSPANRTSFATSISYVSEDGISYITEAAPRSTVRMSHSGVSDIHPAWRPGYAVGEGTVWPGRR